MTNIVLHGELAKAVGREAWQLAVDSVGEALRAIEANTGKLFRYLRDTEGGMVEYRVIIDDKDWTCVEELALPIKKIKTIHIIPVPKGAGDSSGIWMTIVGVILMVVAVVATVYSGGASSGLIPFATALLEGFSGTVFVAGLALTIGGVASLLTPKTGTNLDEKPANRPSYIFNGPVNTYRQGNPVPVGYGTLLIGSQVISAGVRTFDLPNVTKWNDEVSYILGQQVFIRGRYYESKVDGNVGHEPPTFPVPENTWWRDATNQ